MWIRNEEDLRAHLQDPASREGLAVDYKKDVDQNKKKGISRLRRGDVDAVDACNGTQGRPE